ncbi:MAG: tyrosine-type recombinase/integrase [Desulfobacterales bacterium]|nr:tyrosine-type recombinase/integrase [Desulfobacterales bacterium]
MKPTSITPDNNSFTDNVHIPQPHRLSDELERQEPSNRPLQDSGKDRSVSGCDSDDRRRVHHFIGKLLEQDLPGKRDVEQYFRHQYIRNCRPNTIKIIYGVLVPFLVFLKEVGKDGMKEVNRHDVEAFIEHEQDRGLKISTVKTSLAILKAFFRFLMERGVVGEEVFPWKMRIKLPETLPRAMEPEDVDRLLSVDSNARDRSMILLLLRTGMRIGELLSTTLRDVNLREQKILIFEAEKNRLGRVVYFSDDAKKAVEAWLEIRGPMPGLLFPGYKGKSLSYPAARTAFIRYLKRASLSHKGYTLHCLRHTYATELLNALMPIECLEKLLGHKSLEVTRRYARLSDKTREEQYFKAMAIIERRQSREHHQLDCELQTILEKTQLLPSHSEELHEHS